MNFLHYPLNIGANDAVEVTLDKQANVRLLDEANFSKYQQDNNTVIMAGSQHSHHFSSLPRILALGILSST